jgi:hypothetical protein
LQYDNVGISIFIDMTTWRLLFPDGGIKAIFSGLFSVLLWLDLATMKD